MAQQLRGEQPLKVSVGWILCSSFKFNICSCDKVESLQEKGRSLTSQLEIPTSPKIRDPKPRGAFFSKIPITNISGSLVRTSPWTCWAWSRPMMASFFALWYWFRPRSLFRTRSPRPESSLSDPHGYKFVSYMVLDSLRHDGLKYHDFSRSKVSDYSWP